MRLRALSIALAFFLLPATARADDEAARPYFTLGLPFFLGGITSDTFQWGIIGTTSTTAHWGYHLIPFAGPIIGMTAFNHTHCGYEPQCSLPSGVIQGTEVAYLATELAGATLVAIGLYKRTQPRFSPPSDFGDTPGVSLLPRVELTRNGATIGGTLTF